MFYGNLLLSQVSFTKKNPCYDSTVCFVANCWVQIFFESVGTILCDRWLYFCTMACTLRMIRFDRRFDTNTTDSQSDNVEELKAVPELESSKNFLIYKLYKYKDKFARMIDGSQDQYRVCFQFFYCSFHWFTTLKGTDFANCFLFAWNHL